MKYKFVYDGDEIVRSDAEHLRYGTLVHKVLERWFQEPLELMEIYEQEWRAGTVTDLKRYREGESMLLGYERFVGLKEDHKIIALEKKFEFKIGEGVMTGVIDRLEEIDPDTILVVDYKTSFVPLTQDEALYDIQLGTYDLAVRKMYPQYKNVVLQFHYVRLGEVVPSQRSQAEAEALERFLEHLYFQIKNDVEPKATTNTYCNWCEGRDQCDAWRQLMLQTPILGDLEGLGGEQIAAEMELVKLNSKLLEQRGKELQGIFEEWLRNADAPTVRANGRDYYFSSGSRTVFDPLQIHAILGDKFYELITVPKGKLEEMLAGDTVRQGMADAAKTVVRTSSSLRSRQAKK